MKRVALVAALCLAVSFLAGQIAEPNSPGRASVPASHKRTTNMREPKPRERTYYTVAVALIPSSELTWESISENPEQAANTARDFPAGDLRDEWLRIVANEWTRIDAQSAL